jgi:hypothetical protein
VSEAAKSRTRREELVEARARVARQIEILEAGPLYRQYSGATLSFDPELAELRQILTAIETELAGTEEVKLP